MSKPSKPPSLVNPPPPSHLSPLFPHIIIPHFRSPSYVQFPPTILNLRKRAICKIVNEEILQFCGKGNSQFMVLFLIEWRSYLPFSCSNAFHPILAWYLIVSCLFCYKLLDCFFHYFSPIPLLSHLPLLVWVMRGLELLIFGNHCSLTPPPHPLYHSIFSSCFLQPITLNINFIFPYQPFLAC